MLEVGSASRVQLVMLVCQSSWLLLVTIKQIYGFRISFHAKMDTPDTFNLWCQVKAKDIVKTRIKESKF